jgi:hypothetical protein
MNAATFGWCYRGSVVERRLVASTRPKKIPYLPPKKCSVLSGRREASTDGR